MITKRDAQKVTTYHCCIDVDRGINDTTLLSIEGRAACVTAKAMGYKVVPFGPCDDFDYQKGCRGHASEPVGG